MPLVLAPSLVRANLCPASMREPSARGRLYRDLLNYLAFGGIAAGANLAVGWMLYREMPGIQLPYWLATGIAAACGLLVNFLLNYTYFGFNQRSALRQFSTFFIVASVGVVLTGALSQALLGFSQMFLARQPLGVSVEPKFAAHVAAVGLVVFYSFPAHRFCSFNVGLRTRLRQLLRHGVK